MVDLGPATDDEMIDAFVRAEIYSARFREHYEQVLKKSGLDKQSIEGNSTTAKNLRRKLLGCVRGYARNDALFRGFPDDAVWRRVSLSQDEIVRTRYANEPSWIALSNGTRLVKEGAIAIASKTYPPHLEEAVANIRSIADDLEHGTRYAELIGVLDERGEIVLAEGHSRATAYALTGIPVTIECLVGSSPTMRSWAFY